VSLPALASWLNKKAVVRPEALNLGGKERNNMRRLLCLVVALVSSASVAAAQSDYKKFEVFAGYSHNRVDTGIGDDSPALADIVDEREGFHGFNTSVTGNVNRYLGLKFDFAGHFKQNGPSSGAPAGFNVQSRVFNFLGGVQLKDNGTDTTFKPFAHVLAGGAHLRNQVDFLALCLPPPGGSPSSCNFTQSDTGFAAALGGGVDIRASNRVDIRVIQFDYNPTRVFDSTQHNFRIGLGVVIH
jgi:opacity protein-like surface antigen